MKYTSVGLLYSSKKNCTGATSQTVRCFLTHMSFNQNHFSCGRCDGGKNHHLRKGFQSDNLSGHQAIFRAKQEKSHQEAILFTRDRTTEPAFFQELLFSIFMSLFLFLLLDYTFDRNSGFFCVTTQNRKIIFSLIKSSFLK